MCFCIQNINIKLNVKMIKLRLRKTQMGTIKRLQVINDT
jgi:hypothetical protein